MTEKTKEELALEEKDMAIARAQNRRKKRRPPASFPYLVTIRHGTVNQFVDNIRVAQSGADIVITDREGIEVGKLKFVPKE